jgi:hypothetical protein
MPTVSGRLEVKEPLVSKTGKTYWKVKIGVIGGLTWNGFPSNVGDTVVGEYTVNDKGTVFQSVIKAGLTGPPSNPQAIQQDNPSIRAIELALRTIDLCHLESQDPLMLAETVLIIAGKYENYITAEEPPGA